jgi:arylsulfatase A-like enzyme
VVLVDTLRADHVTTERMPRTLAALAGSRSFLDVSANSSWTLPSVASLFTSRPVLDLTAPDGTLVGIPDGRETVAERVRRLGLATAAFVANETVRESNGFGRGFDRYWNVGALGARQPPDASEVIERAREWLGSHRGERAFLYLHFMDPHEPWRDHSGKGRRVPASQVLATRQRPATERETRWMRELYAEEVTHLDDHLGPFLAELPAGSRIVLTSDHGEMLGEHGVWGHGLTLYQPVLRVPLLLRAPGVDAGEDRATRQLLDLAPTLLRLLGEDEVPAHMTGRSLLEPAAGRPPVAATFSAGPLRWSSRAGFRKYLFHAATVPAETASVVLVEVDPLPSGLFLFDLARDPDEDRPIGISGRDLVAFADAFADSLQGFVSGVHRLEIGPMARRPLEWRASDLRQTWSAAEDVGGGGLRYVVLDLEVAQALDPATRAELPREGRPTIDRPGRYLWVERSEPVAFDEQEEILDRLRNLGYIR